MGDLNRLNVAFTRAKQFFYILGNIHYLENIDIWNKILGHYEKNRLILSTEQLNKLFEKVKLNG